MKKIIERINALLLLCLFLLIIITVVFRIFLRIPTAWSEDIGQYLFVFIVFIGSAALMRDESHIKITALIDKMSQRGQQIFRIVGRVLMLFFLIIFTLGAYENVLYNWMVGVPVIPWIKISYMYMVLFFSGVIMIFFILMNLYYDIVGKTQHNVE